MQAFRCRRQSGERLFDLPSERRNGIKLRNRTEWLFLRPTAARELSRVDTRNGPRSTFHGCCADGALFANQLRAHVIDVTGRQPSPSRARIERQQSHIPDYLPGPMDDRKVCDLAFAVCSISHLRRTPGNGNATAETMDACQRQEWVVSGEASSPWR